MQTIRNIPPKLASIALTLQNDPGIHTLIRGLADDGNYVAGRFSEIMRTDVCKILALVTQLAKTSNPTNENVYKLKQTLNNAISPVQETKKIVTLQTYIHSCIEECNKLKIQHETNKKNRLSSICEENASLDESISAHDDIVRALEQSASELEKQPCNILSISPYQTYQCTSGVVAEVLLGVSLVVQYTYKVHDVPTIKTAGEI